MLRMKLLENKKVLFCGYKMAHPLEHEFILNGRLSALLLLLHVLPSYLVQTTPDTTPLSVLKEEVENLITDVTGLLRNIQDELTGFAIN
jgi:DNA-directed RNA polymerase subunit L